MDVFDVRDRVISNYSEFVTSFIRIEDEQIRETIDHSIDRGDLWPEALIQLNPAYARAETTEELIEEGVFHSGMRDVFPGFQLYQHQVNALRSGEQGRPFIVTSGTGSGKSLTFFGTIINEILKNPNPEGVRAVIIYPMNALINSQENEFRGYAQNYKDRTGQDLPVRLAKYTGQEGSDERQRILANPPHIILTNFMMMEYIMMRGAERDLRADMGKHLQFLVYDELHTFRGRQGADVALLNRRLQELRGKPLQFIGTSATMVSGPSSGAERRRAVAQVGTTLFGVNVEEDNVVEEALVSTFSSPEETLKGDILIELNRGIKTDAPEKDLLRSPTAYWLESRIGLQNEEGTLRRRKPFTLSEIAVSLSEFISLDTSLCEQLLRTFLEWVNVINIQRVSQGEKRELLPFKLHQFVAQSGSIYGTLDERGARTVTLEAGVSLKLEEDDERAIYPIVFSRSTGWDYYVVTLDESSQQFRPRDFSTRLPSGIEEDDETVNNDDGYLLVDYDGGGESLFDLDTMRADLPASWFTGTGKPKAAHAHKIPRRVWVSPAGQFSDTSSPTCFIGAFFITTPMVIDLTSGELYSHARSDYAKLTTLGSEARSTSTTILSSSLIDQLIERKGPTSSVAKTLCFTDNRQDASLQSGHFNDFGRVISIRGGLYRALKANPTGLDFATVGPEIRKHIGLSEADYAVNVDPYARSRANEDAFETLVTIRALEDLERSWRITLPNLEQCGLVQTAFNGLDALASDHRWAGFAPMADASPQEREQLLYDFATYLRTEYSIRLKLNEREELGLHVKRISERILPEWGVRPQHRFQEPTVFTLAPTGKVKQSNTRSLGYQSTFGRYLRIHPLFKDHLASRGAFEECITEFLHLLEGALLVAKKVNLRGGGEGSVYALDGTKVEWRLGNGTVPDLETVRRRRVGSKGKVIPPNTFFAERYSRPLAKLYRSSDHTAQVSNADRQDREAAFRAGDLQALYCSPTMELGIDISDLTVVQMRNIPPNPASYTQRSGRAGRGGQAALVIAYAAHRSPHDQNFFHNRLDMVAGVVEAPQLDLSNEALIRTHLHARYVALVNLDALLKTDHGAAGIGALLDLTNPALPLKAEVTEQLSLSSEQRTKLELFTSDLISTLGKAGARFNQAWIETNVHQIPAAFDSAVNRWRSLFRTNKDRMAYAQKVQSDYTGAFTDADKRTAQIEVTRCDSLFKQLLSQGGRNNDNEFYPFRYLATEGFLPGYNFPTRPIRAQVRSSRDDFNYISRSRKVGIREFGPQNVIYHNGGKHTVESLTIEKTNELTFLLEQPMVSNESGYVFIGEDAGGRNTDPLLGRPLDGDGAQTALPRSARLIEVRTMSREYISCEEEERARQGFVIDTFFAVDNVQDLVSAPRLELKEEDQPLIDVRYIKSARLYHFNLGWQRERERGFSISEASGSVLRGKKLEKVLESGEKVAPGIALYTDEVSDAIFIQPTAALGLDQDGVTTLQYALEHAMASVFSIEGRELASIRMGQVEGLPNIMLYESAEGSLGILAQLFASPAKWKEVISEVRKLCAFDDDEEDKERPRASYKDLLSYANQMHHTELDRHLIREATQRLLDATVQLTKGESYADHYKRMLASYDKESTLEKTFIDYLFEQKLALPDEAQKTFKGMYVKPDFYYEKKRTCIFIDGSAHDASHVKESDTQKRQMLEDAGYEVLSYHYLDDLATFITANGFVFTKVEA